MASGLNLKVLQATYKNVNKDVKNLEEQLKIYEKNVKILNEKVWYGGKSADTWYNSATSAYNKDKQFVDKLINIQTKLKQRIDKLLIASK